FTADNPDVRILVRTGHSEEIIDLVLRGEVELGIVRELRDSRVVMRPLYEDELVLVVPVGHPFARTGKVDVAEMRHAQLIMFDRTGGVVKLPVVSAFTTLLDRIPEIIPGARRATG